MRPIGDGNNAAFVINQVTTMHDDDKLEDATRQERRRFQA